MARRRRALWVVGILAAAFAGGAFAQWLMAGCSMLPAQAATGPKEVRAEKFVVVDAAGREIALLGAVPRGVGLLVQGPEGKERVALGVNPEGGAALLLSDTEGRLRLGAATDPTNSGFYLLGAGGKARVGMGLSPTGEEGGFGLSNAKGERRASLGMGGGGVGITLRNSALQKIVEIGAGAGGGGDLVLRHPHDGHVVWQASQQAQAERSSGDEPSE